MEFKRCQLQYFGFAAPGKAWGCVGDLWASPAATAPRNGRRSVLMGLDTEGAPLDPKTTNFDQTSSQSGLATVQMKASVALDGLQKGIVLDIETGFGPGVGVRH